MRQLKVSNPVQTTEQDVFTRQYSIPLIYNTHPAFLIFYASSAYTSSYTVKFLLALCECELEMLSVHASATFLYLMDALLSSKVVDSVPQVTHPFSKLHAERWKP